MAEEQNPLEGLPQGEFIRPASTDIENYLPFGKNGITPDEELYNPTPARQPVLSRAGLPGQSSNIQQYYVKDKATAYPPFAPNQMPQSFKRGDRVTDHINTMIQKRAQSSVDPNVYAKPFMYDATASGANKARYKAYSQKTYDRVGFNPEINNEEVFNANTSMLDDYIRMGTHAFFPMFTNGLFANPRSYGQLLSGDIGQDLESAERYENYNNLGYSTKGGAFGFINNLFNSVAYSAGIMVETTAEMALIGAIEGSIVGPEGTVAGAALGGATGAVKGLFSLPKALYNMGKFGGAMVANLRNLERFNAAQRMFLSAAKTTVNFVNPLENTAGALKAAYGEANNLNNLARASKSAAGFFRDVSFINSGFSEGRLEGGMVENNAYRKGYDRFWKEHNRAPNEQEQLDLRKTAKLAGFQDTWKNGLLVMYSNKIAFPNLFRGNMLSKFTHNVSRFGDEFDVVFNAAKRKAAKAGEETAEKVVAGGTYDLVDFNFRNALKGLIRPANLGKASINYFKTNLVEGTQEVLQDVIAESTEKYYLDAYFDPTKQNFDYSMAAVKDAFGTQAGERGFENFASGFFMGMLLKPFGGAVPRYASMMYTKAKMSEQEYKKYKDERQDYGQRVVNSMNRMNQNPADFLNDRMVNYGIAAKLSKRHNDDETTTKEHKDAVHAGFTSDVLTTLNAGTFDIWKKNFSRFKQLNERELEEAFDLEAGEGTKAKKMLDDYLKKADKLQERHNYTVKTFGSKRINLSNLKEGTPEYDKATIYNKALDRSMQNMIFLQDSFDNNLERLSKMYKGWSVLDPKAKLPGFSFQNLTDPGLLSNTIDLLGQEIIAMKQSMEAAQPNLVLSSKVQEKEDLLNTLNEFNKAQNEYVKAVFKNDAFKVAREKYMKDENLSEGDAELKAFDEIANEYKKSGVNPEEQFKSAYKGLLQKLAGDDVGYQKVISNLNNKSFDDLFNDLKDMHVLNNENSVLTPYINLLLDTDGFFEHVNRNFQWMNNLWSNRKEYYKDVVNKSIELKEYNDLLKSLSDQNIYVDLEQFANWIEDKNNLPDYFIDATAGAERIIPKDSMLYGKYVEEFEKVTKIQEEKPAGNPADLKSQMDQEIDNLLEQKDKELNDAEENFKQDIQEEKGATLEQLRETEAKSKEEVVTESEEDPTQAIMDKFADVIELIESPDVTKVFDAYKIIWQRSLIDIDQFKGDIIKYEKFFRDRLTKIYKDKKRMAEEVMPLANSYDWSDETDKVDAALYNAGIMDLINEEIEKAKKEGTKTVAAEPVILVENSESWKDYQAVIQEIEERYAKLIDDITKKYTEQGLKPDGVEKLTINTEFDSIPDEKFKARLTGLFDEYLKERGQENLLAENPDEYVRLRANWFREQGELIDEYNAGKAAEAIKKEREASILTEPKLLYYKSDGDMVSKPISYLNTVLDGLLFTKQSGKKLNNKKELVDLTEKEIANLNNDIAAIEELIEKKRNIAVPVSNFDKAYDTFKQRILDRQAEVEQILDPEGKVTERRLDGKTPERVTNIAEDIDLELTPGKKKFKYSPLDTTTKKVRDAEGNVIDEVEIPSPVLEIFNLINDDDSIKPEAKADKFIEKFLQLKYPAFEETTKNKITGKKEENPKSELLRKALKEDFSEENVVNTIQRLAFKESSDVGDQMDVMIKTFLTREGTGWKKLDKPDNMPQAVFDNLFGTRGFITRFRDTMIDGNFMIIGASTLLFDKTIGENGLAGETDLIAIDADGNFNIIDIKALTKDKWDVFHGDVRYKKRVSKLTKEGATEEEIAKDEEVIKYSKEAFKTKKTYFRLQQSIYRNLFYNMTGQMPKRIGLLPIEVEYDKLGNIVSAKLSEIVPEDQTTIELFYMPEVETRVPLKAPAVAPTQTKEEQPTEPVYEVVKLKSKKLSDNVGQTVAYQGEIGELILNSDGTYGLKLQDNTVKTITYAIKDVTDGKVTFDQAGILPVQEIKSFGQISTVNGVELDAEFLNDEESKATVNGVLYTVDRNEFGNIESLTYESNSKEISDTQDKISEIDEQINTLREDASTKTTQEKYDQLQARVQELTNAINNTQNEDVIQRLTKKRIVISGQFQQLRNAQNANIRKIAQLEIELKTLEAKVNNLQATNYTRTLSGGNANDIIFALNSLPNSFQKKAAKLKPAAQEQILKTIAAESTSPTASSKIDEVFEDMPFSVDKLWSGGIKAINESDLAEIKAWSNSAIQKLTNLQSELSNRGDLFDDVTNQINTISNFISQLSLIKLNKDGKISKKQSKEAREAFTPETGNAPSETQVPTSGPAEGGTGQATGAKPTTDQMKAALRGINATADELLQGVIPEEGEAESIDKTAEFVSAMNEAKSNKELDKIYYNALKEIDQNPANATFISLNDAYKKATERLASELTAENAKNDGYIILKDDNFGYAKGSVWTVVKENQDGSLDIQDIDGLFEENITQEQLQKNFSRINEESMTQPDVEVSQEDQEIAKDTAKVVEDLLNDSQALKDAEKEVEQAEKKGSFRDKLKNRKCNL